MPDDVKCLTCKHCNFRFETPLTTPEYEGCYTPQYCEQKYLREWAEGVMNAAVNHAMGDTP